MPDHSPTKPFNMNADPDKIKVRDQDNAKPKLQPKHLPINPAPNLAPTGSLGIKRNLPSSNEPAKATKRFTIKKAGDLSKEFKSVASKTQDKGHGWER